MAATPQEMAPDTKAEAQGAKVCLVLRPEPRRPALVEPVQTEPRRAHPEGPLGPDLPSPAQPERAPAGQGHAAAPSATGAEPSALSVPSSRGIDGSHGAQAGPRTSHHGCAEEEVGAPPHSKALSKVVGGEVGGSGRQSSTKMAGRPCHRVPVPSCRTIFTRPSSVTVERVGSGKQVAPRGFGVSLVARR